MIEKLKEFNYPDWAKYVAVDNNGEVYAYENEPDKDKDYNVWYSHGGAELIGLLKDFDDNVVIKVDDLLLEILKDGEFGPYTITSPLNNVGKEVYIIHGNKIIKERVSKVMMTREESNDGTLMPLEESYYFVTLNLWKDVSEVYFDKDDLLKGL